MSEFDVRKVITIKYSAQAEVGKKYFYSDLIEDLEMDYLLYPERAQPLEKIEANTFRIGDDNWKYLYPYTDPETSYRPFNEDEMYDLLGKVIRKRGTNIIQMITRVDPKSVKCDDIWVTSRDLLKSFEFVNADKTTAICGVLDE